MRPWLLILLLSISLFFKPAECQEKRSSMGGSAFGSLDRIPLSYLRKFYRQKTTKRDENEYLATPDEISAKPHNLVHNEIFGCCQLMECVVMNTDLIVNIDEELFGKKPPPAAPAAAPPAASSSKMSARVATKPTPPVPKCLVAPAASAASAAAGNHQYKRSTTYSKSYALLSKIDE